MLAVAGQRSEKTEENKHGAVTPDRSAKGETLYCFISQNLTETEAVTACIFACVCHTVFRMFSCYKLTGKPLYLGQLLKFHLFDWLIEMYFKTNCQGAHHKMVSLQPVPGFSPLSQRSGRSRGRNDRQR